MITAPAAKTALVAMLREAHGADVVVRRGLPAAVPTERQRIYVASATEYQRQGDGEVRLERYRLLIVIEAQPSGAPRNDEGQQAETEMWALVQSVETVLQQDPELGGVVWSAVFDGADELATAPTDTGWIASARVWVAVESQVRG